jgi:hypothetical protein
VSTVAEQSTETSLDLIRHRRAELREAMGVVERALAAPAPGRAVAWAERVSAALRQLHADFAEHIAVTEGPDGLYEDVLASAPRLSNAIRRLTAEHEQITADLDVVGTRMRSVASPEEVDDIRTATTALLARLARHRQRGADLVFEAYEVDVGGET